MKGAPPDVFNGERSQTSKFMLQFQIWWMVNNRAEAMINPFQWITLCLSFIRGKRVDKWVEEKINQLRRAVVRDPMARIPPTHADTDERLWHAFGTDFRNAFQDTAAEENTYEALKSLTIKDNQIDEYITHFEVLIPKAGWQQQEKGSINIFFNGLTKNIQRKILSIYAVLPVTLDEWQAAARQVVQRNRLIDVKIGPRKPREHKPNQRWVQNQEGKFYRRSHDPDAMDIDSADIDPTDIKLASDEGERKPPVRCYYCDNLGHIRADCCKYKAAQKDKPDTETKVQATDQRNMKPERTRRVLPTCPQEVLMAHIRSMRTEDLDDFLDHILPQSIESLLDRPETTIYVRTIEADTAYAERTKAMCIEITLSSVPRVAEERALLDSGASENLISEETWKTLRTKAFTLPKPVAIYNLDGTENAQGRISQYCWLRVRQGDKGYTMRFFIAEMEKDHLILGHSFFSVFNPEIDWKKKKITGPAIDISTIGFRPAQELLRKTQLRALRVCGRRPRSGEMVYYRRVVTNQEEPYQWQKKQARVAIQRLPKEHWKVFHQEKQSPKRKGNRKIPL
jgi:Retrotransposon gag protein